MQFISYIAERKDSLTSGAVISPFAKVSVYLTGTSTLASLFNSSGAPLSGGNPAMADINGIAAFAVPDGEYDLQFQSADLSYTSPKLMKVQVVDVLNLSGAVTVANRTALAAIGSPGAGSARYLAEAGREGWFVFSSANLSAQVSVDTAQGIYVAPSGATSGASGAWVRKYTGFGSVKWTGALGDGVTLDQTAESAALADAKAAGVNNALDIFYIGAPRIYHPVGNYKLNSTLDFDFTAIFEGDGAGAAGGRPSLLTVAAGLSAAIRISRSNTSGDTGVRTEVPNVTTGGDGTTIRNLALAGGHSGTNEAEAHAILLRARANIDDMQIKDFQGDAIRSVASAGLGAPFEGNANGARIFGGRIIACRNAVFKDGSDNNAWMIAHLDAAQCWQAGIYDSGFLHTAVIACQFADCGYVKGGTVASTVANVAGTQWFTPRLGRETQCSTNAPPSTAVDDVNWLWWAAGGPDTTTFNVPTWTNGMTVRAGGPILCDNANNAMTVVASYFEGGQPPIQGVDGQMFIVGGAVGVRVVGAAWIYASLGKVASNGYHRIESRELGGTAYHELGAGDGSGYHLREISNPLISPWRWFERFDSDGNLCLSNLDSFVAGDNPYLISPPTAVHVTCPWGDGRVNYRFGFGLGDKKIYSGTAMPTSGSWNNGDYFKNNAYAVLGTAGAQYFVRGWARITTGSGNVLNTDWVEDRGLTGT